MLHLLMFLQESCYQQIISECEDHDVLLHPLRIYLTLTDIGPCLEVWSVDVLATSLAMYVICTMHDVASKQLEVDVGKLLEVVVQRCLLRWEYSKTLMTCHMMWQRTDVALHVEVVNV